MGVLRTIWAFLRAFFASRAALAAENVMLRQQLIVVQRSVPRPKLTGRKRKRISGKLVSGVGYAPGEQR